MRQELSEARRGLDGMDGITAVVLEARCNLGVGEPLGSCPQGDIDISAWECLDGALRHLRERLLGHRALLLPGGAIRTSVV
jgi:hypothetical protein